MPGKETEQRTHLDSAAGGKGRLDNRPPLPPSGAGCGILWALCRGFWQRVPGSVLNKSRRPRSGCLPIRQSAAPQPLNFPGRRAGEVRWVGGYRNLIYRCN
ncbi:hypothetical protein [Devosia sp. DBB001]|nr:hypothetical protein [Devosia sp. DBB001]